MYAAWWCPVAKNLPEPGRQVVLINENRFWNTPDGVQEANVTAAGYLAYSHTNPYWSIFGERGMELNAFTHWCYLPNPEPEED